jgi:spore cortex formation protein SpoVR/YcgB (stage V sporulation)
MVPFDQLKAETVALFEKDYGSEEVEEIIDLFLVVLENNRGRIVFTPSPLPGPAQVVQVGQAVSRDSTGRK